MKQKQYSRAERKRQMIHHVVDRFERGGKLHTAYSLAAAMDMARSRHFLNILNELVQEGVLKYHEVGHRPNKTKHVFYPDYDRLKSAYPKWEKELRQEKKERQTIRLNAGGGQLELFADWRN